MSSVTPAGRTCGTDRAGPFRASASVPGGPERRARASRRPRSRSSAAAAGTVRDPAGRPAPGPRPGRPARRPRTDVNGAPGHSVSPTSGEAPGATITPSTWGTRPARRAVGAPCRCRRRTGADGEDQLGAGALDRVGEHGRGVRHGLRGHTEGGVADDVALLATAGKAQHLDTVGAEEGDRRARVRLAQRAAQPGLDQRKNISHAASIELAVKRQSGALTRRVTGTLAQPSGAARSASRSSSRRYEDSPTGNPSKRGGWIVPHEGPAGGGGAGMDRSRPCRYHPALPAADTTAPVSSAAAFCPRARTGKSTSSRFA